MIPLPPTIPAFEHEEQRIEQIRIARGVESREAQLARINARNMASLSLRRALEGMNDPEPAPVLATGR